MGGRGLGIFLGVNLSPDIRGGLAVAARQWSVCGTPIGRSRAVDVLLL